MDIIMPQLGETVTEGVVTKWYKKVGDTIKADETLFDVETDKVSTEIPSPVAGVVAEIVVAEGITAKVGVRLAVIRESGSVQPATTVGAAPIAAAAPSSISRANAADRLSPVVRRLVAEHSLNPADITGTGRDRRITREDVTEFIARRGARPAAMPAAAPALRRNAGCCSCTASCRTSHALQQRAQKGR